MGLKRKLTRNVTWNWIGLAVGMVSGFVLAPFYVNRLGESSYGLWILVLSVSTTLLLLDVGVRGAIGRYVALHKALGDGPELRAIVKTGHFLLALAALAAMAGTLLAIPIFVHTVEISPEHLGEVRIAIILTGASVAFTLAMGMFDAMLWAHERFDVLNAIDICTTVLQAVASVWLVLNGHFLLALSGVMLLAVVIRETGKAIACWRLGILLGTRGGTITWAAVRCLTGYALWNFLAMVGQRGGTQAIAMLIGAHLPLARLTQYTVASTLTGYARNFTGAATGILIPLSTALHATDRRADQQRLFLDGSRYSWALALLLGTGLILLGETFIVLWMGPQLRWSAPLLMILAAGEMLPMSQGIAASLLRGMNRHRLLAAASLIEAGSLLALGIVLASIGDLLHICMGVAICGLICRGLVPMCYACRLLGLPLHRMVMHSIVPPLLVLFGPALALLMAVRHRPPRGWIDFFAYAVLFTIAYAGACVLLWRHKPRTDPAAWTAPAIAESA